VNKTKTLKMKLIYIVAAIAMLAMLIPALALPVSAADGYHLDFTTLEGDYDGGYDITGDHIYVSLMDSEEQVAPPGTATGWSIVPASAGASFAVDPGTISPIPSTVEVSGDTIWNGQFSIEATVSNGNGGSQTIVKTKKFAPIDKTTFTGSSGGTSMLAWSEDFKGYFAMQSITDTVTGIFPGTGSNPVQGVVLHWFLYDSEAVVPTADGNWWDLVDYYEDLGPKPSFVSFTTSATFPFMYLGPMTETLTDDSGACTVNFAAWDKESVKIVVVPELPNRLQDQEVTPEVTSWTFNKAEFPVVPQVRWVGEKNCPREILRRVQ